jgi:hypothetical protein
MQQDCRKKNESKQKIVFPLHDTMIFSRINESAVLENVAGIKRKLFFHSLCSFFPEARMIIRIGRSSDLFSLRGLPFYKKIKSGNVEFEECK